MPAEFASAILTTTITLVVVVAGALVGGFWLLSRRRLRFGPADRIEKSLHEAKILLVRADDAVTAAEDEVGFAIAQFGEKTAEPFVTALATARAQLREAFALQQRLDDAYPDTLTQRRDWSNRVAMLCRSAQSTLDAQTAQFRGMRRRESNAPQTHDALSKRRDALTKARDAASATLVRLAKEYAPRSLASVTDNVRRADASLELATSLLAETETQLSTTTTSTGSTLSDRLEQVAEHLSAAEHMIDAIETLETQLGKARQAAAQLRVATAENLAEARALRDAPPDPASSQAVATAMRQVEEVLAEKSELADPLLELERLRQANAALDASMASARNQQRRLDGARTALTGALVQARSQLATTSDYIAGRRGGVGADARTRIAEAQRLLMLAEAESDPVTALDLARSSATHSRDADALARYDLMRA